jgi:hypothetical protein
MYTLSIGRMQGEKDQSSPFQGPPFISNWNKGAMFFLFHTFQAACILLTMVGFSAARSFSYSMSVV